ncbi:MAG: hypothetical protein KGO94_03740 [Alphaproteobacteria bacterium]|nr:hypothetical protein [Alphaproteobacteria bacterium]
MNYRVVSGVLVASLLSATVVQAAVSVAELGSIQGKVLVNKGEGFVALTNGTELNAGDRVMVGKDSAATIAYANGCAVSVNAAQVVTVAKTAPCKAGASVSVVGSNLVAPVADVPGGYAPAAGLGAALPLLLIGGGAAVVGGILILNNNNGGTPASAPPL